MKSSLPSTIINATTYLISPAAPTRPRSSLAPHSGAPLTNETSLVPSKYLPETRDEDAGPTGHTSSVNLHPARSAPPERSTTLPSPGINLVRSPPSQLLDAPARAAFNMPNSATASAQARAVRGKEVRTPEFGNEDEEGMFIDDRGRREERQPLLAPTNQQARPSLSRTSSNGSTSSNRSILRRIFIDRASTPNQHLSRPTFPPPSASTYSPHPYSPLTVSAKLNLLLNQTISAILSTFFLAFVVAWALAAELARGLPKWVWPSRPRSFPWDDDRYWKKEGTKISKDPSDYARQVGMEIEHQTIETDDGYYLK